MREFFDLTIPIGGSTPVYPGDPVPLLERVLDLNQGAPLTASVLTLSCHVGTHVDLPAHFLGNGANLADYPLHRFFGPALVVDLRGHSVVEETVFDSLSLPMRHHLLLKTDNSRLLSLASFSKEYTYVTPAAAQKLLACQPLSVGIDYYSLDPPNALDFPSHLLLAAAGLPVIVCLNLDAVQPGLYNFAAFPLHIPAAEGAPVRAALWR